MYPNWDFWVENKPSGNPDCDHIFNGDAALLA
jgi:hypothetical protein